MNALVKPVPIAVCFSTRRPGYNNTRYASLFPRLTSEIQFHEFRFSNNRIIRGVQGRVWNTTQDALIYPTVLARLNRKYKNLYTIDFRQIPHWHGKVIIDIDDPEFTSKEIQCLNLPNVKAIIVTTEKTKEILQGHGISTRIEVIPQGVSISKVNLVRVEEIKSQYKKQNLVVGYQSPRLTLASDGAGRAKQGLNDLDILVRAVESARKVEPRVVLWLLGHPSDKLKQFAKGAPWVRLFGYVPFEDTLNFVANFDIGTYPRTIQLPLGRFSVKIAQCMACGVPIVATNVDEALMLGETKSGLVTDSAEAFSNALGDLVQSEALRKDLGGNGARFAKENLDWDVLIPRYKKILTDVFAPQA